MELFCPDSSCPNHHPSETHGWLDYHGSYFNNQGEVQRYRCRHCGRTFSERSLSIDYWTHSHIDYLLLIILFVSGFSLRGLSRFFNTTVTTIQNRISRLARTILPTMGNLQELLALDEDLVADGLENFCVSQDFPNNIHILVGKISQFTYGMNYALMRRTGRRTEEQKLRCEELYPQVDFSQFTIKKTFKELIVQMRRLCDKERQLTLYTDERIQYQLALKEDPDIQTRIQSGKFSHETISSKEPRTLTNDLFSVNYIDREARKDVPEFRRETVCIGRNVGNCLERLTVYLFHHNFIKKYRIGVSGEDRTHAEVAGISKKEVDAIIQDAITRRRFIKDGEVVDGGFLDLLWRRKIPTPLAKRDDYLPKFAVA